MLPALPLGGSEACPECAARHACSPNRTLLHSRARYMRGSHFPGWARPREFHARLLESVGRHEEARDNVRACACWLLLGRHCFKDSPSMCKQIFAVCKHNPSA